MNKIFKPYNKKIWIILLVSLLIGLISYKFLPEQIPIHFDEEGNVDNYGNRLYIFLEPAIILFMIVLAEVARNVDPKKNVYNRFIKQYYLLFFLVSLLMLFIQLYSIAVSLNVNVINISTVMPLVIGLLFAIIGKSMPKYKQNYYVGIKTSWTLADEEVWDKTHKLGGKVWIIGGIMIMLTTILPNSIKTIAFLFIVALIILIPTIYSLVIYKRKYD